MKNKILVLITAALLSSCGNGIEWPGVKAPSPPTRKRVFVSNARVDGNLGGVSGANALCNTYATNARIGGNWRAWISDTTNNAINNINDVSPWYLVNNTSLIFATKASIVASGPDLFIDMDEYGNRVNPAETVWTATDNTGNYDAAGNTCTDWTANAVVSGSYGFLSIATCGTTSQYCWTWNPAGVSSVTCDNLNHIYCFEQ